MLIHQFLEHSAAIFPDKVAVICDDARCTYEKLNSSANRLADWLINQGVESGDRVAILLNNSIEYVVSYYGILKAGGISAPLSSDMKPGNLRELLQKLGAKVLITSGHYERLVEATGSDALGIRTLLVQEPTRSWNNVPFNSHSWKDAMSSDGNPNNPDSCLTDSSLGSILFTSGSTGQPKGVMLSHANIVANTLSIKQYLRLSSADRQMVVLPFHYVMGKSLLNTHIAVGGSIVINNRFAFPADVLQQMEKEKVTGFSGVPSTYTYLLHRSPLRSYRDRLESLRYCSQAGGHMSWQIKQDLLTALPSHTRLYVMYGATEAAARLSFVEPDRLLEKPDSIGRAIPGVSLRIMDDHGRELPVGQVGELVAEGANIMKGYWRDETSTAAALGPSGYHTGDLAYRDEDGYFFIVGRKDNQIKVGGHRLDPQEVENALMSTGLLMEVTVFGVPDVLLENRLIALIVPIQKECAINNLLAQCAVRLPRHKVPAEIKVVSALPKNPSGKLDVKRCRELFGNDKQSSSAAAKLV